MSILDLLGVDQNGNASPLDARDTASSDPIGAIERVALQNGINPDHLIGLAKLETRLGDATIKGDGQDTFNLFNIKDFSKEGTGIRARDKAEGSNDRYRRYDSYEASAQDLVSLLERRYPGALTAATPEEFAKALKAGGYATDPAYVQKLTSTIGSSTNGSSTKNTAQPSDSVVDRLIGKDEALNLIFGGSNGLVDVPQPEPIKNRSFGDVLRDTGIAALKVGPTAVNQIAEVGDMLTGGKFDFGVSKTMKRGMEAFDELGSEGFKRSKEGFAAVMQDDTKGIGDMFAYALDNPAVLVDNIIPTVGSMFLPAGAAKVAAGGARLMGAAQPVVQKAAVATSIGAGAAQNAAQTFAELKDKSLPERYAGAATSFAVSALMGIATGGGADGAIARRMAGELKEGKIGLDKVKSFLKSVGKEALQESGEESGNVLGKYVGSGELPSPQSYGKQVAFSGALGGLMGGGVDLATGQSFGSGGIQPAEAPATPAPNGPLTRALNAGAPVAQPAPQAPTEAAPAVATPPAVPPAAPPVAPPDLSNPVSDLGQEEIDPEMAAMADTDLDALITGIESKDEAAVSDDDWVRYYLAKEEIKRRKTQPGTPAAAAPVQEAAPQAPEQAAEAATEPPAEPAGTYMPGAEVNANRPKEQPKVVLQNRDRSGAASVQQMSGIAANPDFLRIGPSTEMTTGAPVVFGDLPATAVKGRPETVVDGKGDRIQAQYAVVDARDLIASNNADGTPVESYVNGLPGKLRAVAGNGRTAGIQKAYQQGTAEKYRQDLIEQAQTMGLDAAAIEAMQQPVLVRVMDAADVRDDMGDRTNITGTQRLSPVEQAANDARRLNLADLSFDENGNPTQETLRRFINTMPDAEKGDLIAGKEGTPTRQAAERLMAATFKQAYDSDELVELYAQAPEPEARAILNAAAEAAGALSALKEMNPDFDVREAVAGAVKMAVNASRQQKPLAEFAQNADLDTDPDAFAVARFLGKYANKPRQMANGLREWARDVLGQAEIDRTNQSQGGLFGAQPTLTRDQLFARLGNIDPNDQATIQAREALAKRDAEKAATQEQAPTDAAHEAVPEAPGFDLEAQTPEQLQAQADERAAEEKRQRDAEQAAEAKAQADAELGDFTLTGSDRPADANPNQGDLLAADQPQQGENQAGQEQTFAFKPAAEKKAREVGGTVTMENGRYVVQMPSAQPEQRQDATLTNEGTKPAIDPSTLAAKQRWEQRQAEEKQQAAQNQQENERYNAYVQEQEKDAERRRLQGDNIIQQANGKPFKTEASAQAKLDEFDLADTHAIQKTDKGFVLRRMPPAEQAERSRKAEGRESYMEAQAAVLAEMGIGETADGEIDATDEQFAEIERRTAERLGRNAQPADSKPNQPQAKQTPAVAATENIAPEQSGDALERKTDEVMEKVVVPGMLNFTRDQVRALIQEKGVEAADKTIADYQASKAKQAETTRKYSEAKDNADRAKKTQAEAANDKPELAPRSLNNRWISVIGEWDVLGEDEAKNHPGFASEKSARIAISKNPEWKRRGATVLPFDYNDGSYGMAYSDTRTRYVIVARKSEVAPEANQPPAQQVPAEVATENVAKQPDKTQAVITRADVAAAERLAADMIRQKIAGMKAGEVQRIAARFLPTMGKKAPVGKAKIADAMTDTSAFSLLNPAAELGVELSESVKRALMADREGRVVESSAEAPADQPIPAAEPQRFEYPTPLPGQPEEITQGQRAVVDFMNGDIDKPTMLRRFAEIEGLRDYQIRQIMTRLDGISQYDLDQVQKAREELAKRDKPVAEPNPLEFTPKQYADAWLRWSAETNGLPLAEVREMQGDEAGLKAIEQRWVDAVVNQAKSGQSLPTKTLDKLLEIRPNTTLPESAIPAGYQRPEARKLEKARKSAPAENELEAIFSALEAEDSLKKRRAKSALKERPDAEVINQVESQFYDMLLSLMERGDLEVNGHKTIHKDNKSCL